MAAELLLILALGALLFWALRPLRDRIERWFARNVLGESRGGRVVDLRRRNNGAFGAEDPDGD